MSSQHTSLSLLDRLAGTPETDDWSRLTEIYSPLLRNWLRSYQVQPADADDLVQEVLATLHREIGSFEHNAREGAFRTWLRGILVNRLREHWRAKKYRPAPADGSDYAKKLDALADEASGLTKAWDAEHDRLVMRRLVSLIQPRFESHVWQAFELQTVGGLTAKEVAAKLNISLDVAYAAKSRVLQALRQEARGLVD